MDINGDIPFQMLYLTQDDKKFAAVGKTILRGIEPRSRVTVEDTKHCTTQSPSQEKFVYFKICVYTLWWSNG